MLIQVENDQLKTIIENGDVWSFPFSFINGEKNSYKYKKIIALSTGNSQRNSSCCILNEKNECNNQCFGQCINTYFRPYDEIIGNW